MFPVRQRVVIKETKAMAETMVRLLDDADIDSYRRILKHLREKPEGKEDIVSRLQVMPKGNWWTKWLLKALGPKKVILFPIQVHLEAAEQIRIKKLKVSCLLFANRLMQPAPFRDFLLGEGPEAQPSNPIEAGIYSNAVALANQLVDTLKPFHVDLLIEILEISANGGIDREDVVDRIASKCHLHVDLFEGLFAFIECDLSPSYRNLLRTRCDERRNVSKDLQAELQHFLNSYHGVETPTMTMVNGAEIKQPTVRLSSFDCLEAHLKVRMREQASALSAPTYYYGTALPADDANDANKLSGAVDVDKELPAASLLRGVTAEESKPKTKFMLDNLPSGTTEEHIYDALKNIGGGAKKVWLFHRQELKGELPDQVTHEEDDGRVIIKEVTTKVGTKRSLLPEGKEEEKRRLDQEEAHQKNLDEFRTLFDVSNPLPEELEHEVDMSVEEMEHSMKPGTRCLLAFFMLCGVIGVHQPHCLALLTLFLQTRKKLKPLKPKNRKRRRPRRMR